MLANVDIKFPKELKEAMHGSNNSRVTFRRTMENRLRPPMNALVNKLKHVTIYPAIADDFALEEETTEVSVAFAAVNRNPAAQYLEAPEGTRPHLIVQRPHVVPLQALLAWSGGNVGLAKLAQARIARRGVTIHHPGTRPDRPVHEEMEAAVPGLVSAAMDGAERWASSYGTKEG